jgi:hypothetical protein
MKSKPYVVLRCSFMLLESSLNQQASRGYVVKSHVIEYDEVTQKLLHVVIMEAAP